jgi:7-cyano-7-deazaguanine synthase in queuosine biosynthesis
MRYAVFFDQRPPEIDDIEVSQWFRVGENLRTGETDFQALFGQPTSLERDLLVLASSIFAADLTDQRGKREEITRDIHLAVPVVNYHALENQRVALERILHFLSHDNWTLRFLPMLGVQEPLWSGSPHKGKTLLFSGGLDSLAAAVNLLDEFGGSGVQLASHVTGNPATRGAQNRLFKYLSEQYRYQLDRAVVWTGRQNPKSMADDPNTDMGEEDLGAFKDDPEVSQRTRSFTFLTIAVLAARRRGMTEVVMIAENGQMAIHLPLSAGRIGAFSTHTAHPKFVKDVGDFFRSVLQYSVQITNPFVYTTKAEVVAKLAASHAAIIGASNSCWKTARIGGKHCGECIPCLVRRIALEYHGVDVDKWKRDMFGQDFGKLKDTDDGKRNLTELATFAQDFRLVGDEELGIRHCDLRTEDFDRKQVIQMYKRFADEMFTVLSQYPNLAHLL